MDVLFLNEEGNEMSSLFFAIDTNLLNDVYPMTIYLITVFPVNPYPR